MKDRSKKESKLLIIIFAVLIIFSASFIIVGFSVGSNGVLKSDDYSLNAHNAAYQLNADKQTTDVDERKTEEKIAEIEHELTNKNTNVIDELNEKIRQYEAMLESEDAAEKRLKLINLIEQTNSLISQYDAFKTENVVQSYSTKSAIGPPIPVVNPNLAPSAYVAAVISAFSALGYDLSAELTTVALTNKYVATEYCPIFYSRVLSSQVLYDLATGTQTSGGSEFSKENLFNTYAQDLYFAIRRFNYSKPSADSKTVQIIDTYDYDKETDRKDEDTGIQGVAYDLMYNAQKAGVIHPVKLKITADITDFLRLQIDSKIGSTWHIKVTNFKDTPIDVVYNSKMCFRQDAENWTGLKDIKTIRIAANSSKVVSVDENFNATHFAFCFHEENKRVITYAHHTYLADYSLNTDINKINYQYYSDIGIIGKNGDTWIINVTNTHSERKELQYNAKMCYESDAKKWTGLKDVVYCGYLEQGENRVIEIKENFFATDIAVRLIGETEDIIIYAEKLSTNCTMDVARVTNYIYRYLNLRNLGKSGSYWKIQVYNPTDSTVMVFYNSKMCFESDARNWTNLKDVSQVYVGAGSTVNIDIKTNFSATCVTFCYYRQDDKRIVSYANKLDKNGNINVMYNYM